VSFTQRERPDAGTDRLKVTRPDRLKEVAILAWQRTGSNCESRNTEDAMRVQALSPAALSLFKRHIELGRTIELEVNRPLYEELARAGLMIVGNSFAGGQDSVYSVTKEGFERKAELFADAKEAG
jgi:hypothetical protein